MANIEALDQEQDLQQLMLAHRQQVSKGGKLRTFFQQSPAQYVMRFQDFQKPIKRNKILVGLGLQPIHLPIDRKPKRRKPALKHRG